MKRTCRGINFKGGGTKRKLKYSTMWKSHGMRVPCERTDIQFINTNIFT